MHKQFNNLIALIRKNTQNNIVVQYKKDHVNFFDKNTNTFLGTIVGSPVPQLILVKNFHVKYADNQFLDNVYIPFLETCNKYFATVSV